jgi:hypothetical protein
MSVVSCVFGIDLSKVMMEVKCLGNTQGKYVKECRQRWKRRMMCEVGCGRRGGGGRMEARWGELIY